MLSQEDLKKVKETVVDVIKEVVMPAFEHLYGVMATKEDIKKLATKKELEAVKDRVFQIDQKVDRILDKQMIHDVKIKKLENALTA